jgi:homoserine kinase
VVAVVVGVVIVAVIVCGDADFVANPSKEMLLTAVALSSCLRVRTRCNFFMGRSHGEIPSDGFGSRAASAVAAIASDQSVQRF